MSRKNNGGTVAIIITIVLTGGLIVLALSNKNNNVAASTSTADDSMAGHHSGSTGPTSNLETLVGKPAPDFSLTDHNGKTYTLAGLKGKDVVLFFNEGVMCYPACWNQIASLGSDVRLNTDGVVSLSVVVDSQKEWEQAVSQMPELAKGTVVHDNGAKVSTKYGMLITKSSMHNGQLPGHSYVVIDKEGIVRHVLDDPNMAIHNDGLATELTKI